MARVAPAAANVVRRHRDARPYARPRRHAVALGPPAALPGALGSKAKVKRIFDALQDEGVAAESLKPIHAPIGLAIGAITPQEIAVSIVAELIAVKHGKISDPGAAAVSMRRDGALA